MAFVDPSAFTPSQMVHAPLVNVEHTTITYTPCMPWVTETQRGKTWAPLLHPIPIYCYMLWLTRKNAALLIFLTPLILLIIGLNEPLHYFTTSFPGWWFVSNGQEEGWAPCSYLERLNGKDEEETISSLGKNHTITSCHLCHAHTADINACLLHCTVNP